MPPQTIKLIIAGLLLLHALGHTGAFVATAGNWTSRATATGAWLPARSWVIPSLAPQTAKTLAGIFWVLSTIGFVAAAMSFLGIVVPDDAWRELALVSSFISILGITLFLGTWPGFNTIAAIAVNIAVLVTQLWLRWPPESMLGR